MSDGQAQGAKKTKGQDYTACLAFLPEGVWSRVMKASTDRQRAEELVHFCYTTLSLRYPSEPTYATWTSLVASFDPECSSFDLRSKYETVKNVWQNAKTRLARTHAAPAVLLPKLPVSFDDLTAEMQAAYGEARPLAQWPISTQEVDRQFLRVPMRSLHASLQEEKKDAVHKLADAIMKRIDGGGRRRNDEASNMLPGLKIFSPGKRTGNADVAGSEKRSQMAALSNGQGVGTSSREPARFLSLTDGGMALRASVEAKSLETGLDQKVLEAASKEQDLNLQLVSVKPSAERLLRRGSPGMEPGSAKRARMEGLGASPTGQHVPGVRGQLRQEPDGNASVPAGHVSNTDTGTYEGLAREFLEARKTEQMPKVAESSSWKPSKKKPSACAALTLKRPAGCFKRPAAKGQKDTWLAAEVSGLQNTTFDAHKYGKCKVEYYTHKSYIRHFQEKWVMIVGSSHPKHKNVCNMLVPHVKKGASREELLSIRERIIQRLAE